MNANQVKSYALALALSSTSTFIMGCDTENIEDGDVADLSENAQSVVDAMKLAGYEFLGTGTEKAEASDIDEDVRVFSFEHAQSGEGVDMLFSTNQDQEQTEPILRPWTGADEERLAALGDESLIEEADEFRGSWYYTGCSYIQKVGFNFGCINLTSNPAGYYKTYRVRYGYSYSGPPSLYSWWADWQGKAVVCPYQETSTYTYAVCGLP